MCSTYCYFKIKGLYRLTALFYYWSKHWLLVTSKPKTILTASVLHSHYQFVSYPVWYSSIYFKPSRPVHALILCTLQWNFALILPNHIIISTVLFQHYCILNQYPSLTVSFLVAKRTRGAFFCHIALFAAMAKWLLKRLFCEPQLLK